VTKSPVETSLRWDGQDGGVLNGACTAPLRFSQDQGGDPQTWSPLSLLLGAIESSVLLAFGARARGAGIAIDHYHSSAEGELDGAGRLARAVIRPTVFVASAWHAQAAARLFERLGEQSAVTASLKVAVAIEPLIEVVPHNRGELPCPVTPS
jgi:hypothetical protein